jgi:DNA invertase Pin-like site-specific DNA recombinase
MLVGYARTSTEDQTAGFEAQLRDLTAAGCEKLYSEQVSSVAERAQLELCLSFLREGDALLVTKLDRLARSVADLVGIIARLQAKGVAFRVIGQAGLDTETPSGKLMINLLGSIAQFEREIMLERQREGIARAKAAGKFKGRAPTARRQLDKVRELSASGIGASEIAKRLGIGRTSVYRLLA